MRTGTLLLAAAAALLAPPSAAAFEWNARAAAEYFRSDATLPSGESVTYPRLDLDLSLDAGGSLVAPSVFSWSGGAQYRRIDRSSGAEALDDQVSYRLRASLFQDPRSPATVRLHAQRIDGDSTLAGAAAGSLLQTAYGADLSLQGPGRPHLRAGYSFSDLDQESVAFGPRERTVHTFSGATGHGSTNFSWGARYRANLSEGTYASDNFDDHRVDLDVDVDATASTKVRLADVYFLRKPTTTSPFNPRQELNSLSASVMARGEERDLQSVTYYYAHGLQEVPLSPTTERTRHRAAYLIDRRLPSPEWRLRGTADVAFTEDRLGAVPARTVGETAGAVLFWRRGERGDHVEVRAGPSVGLLHPDAGGAELGWGGTAGATLLRGAGPTSLQLTYDATWESDLRGVEGWRLSQAVLGSASRPLGRGSVRGMLQASASRRESPLLGPAATRSVIATGAYRWGSNDVQLQAGVQDNAAGTVGDEIGGDALFLTSYDNHVRFAQLDARVSPWRFVALRGRLRLNSTDIPDRPAYLEVEGIAGIDFTYGAIVLGVEDRYLASEVGGNSTRVNQFLVRVSRTFGSRF